MGRRFLGPIDPSRGACTLIIIEARTGGYKYNQHQLLSSAREYRVVAMDYHGVPQNAISSNGINRGEVVFSPNPLFHHSSDIL